MDAKTVFIIVSLTILANGAVLAIAYRSLPAMLRSAARYWQWGTFLIAVGCALFAYGAFLPRPWMLTLANGGMVFGLAAYSLALSETGSIRRSVWLYVPAAAATASVFWFSTVLPDFKIRVILVSIAWLWLAAAAMQSLTNNVPRPFSSSRKLLVALYILFVVCTSVRLVIYLSLDLPADFAVEASANAWNLVSAIVLTMLPIVGTTAFLLFCSDMLRERLEYTAATDYLTNLPNRRAVTEKGTAMFDQADGAVSGFAVAVVDIDHFKAINDAYGHEVGDQALIHTANLLRRETRADDMVGRSGGEEFTVLFQGVDSTRASVTAERMRRALEAAEFVAEGQVIPITVSAGISARLDGDHSFEDVLRRADKALYLAKSRGRNRVELG